MLYLRVVYVKTTPLKTSAKSQYEKVMSIYPLLLIKITALQYIRDEVALATYFILYRNILYHARLHEVYCDRIY